MGYRGTWASTDQIPERAVQSGLIERFGAVDSTDGGDTYRYSGSVEWQRTRGHASTKVTAYRHRIRPRSVLQLHLFSRRPGSRRSVSPGGSPVGEQARRSAHRRLGEWAGRAMQNTFGVQVRNDDITSIGLSHTEARRLLETVRQDSVVETSAGAYAQNEIQWNPLAPNVGGHPRGRLSLQCRCGEVPQRRRGRAPVLSVRKAGSSLDRLKGPSSM